ncbi:MAG: hypothetical protein NTW17_00950 [Candidatus Pacearchaeota archaeon]|nr:hypothetical protein [Candidatus Pacearchaeota archaeon]
MALRLNLGCGKDRKKGYLNVDSSPLVNPDKILNLEKTPLPFKKDSVEEILAYHVLEHIHNFIPLMHEFRRICKNNAVIKIKTPFYSSWGQFNDPTHVRFFTPFTFNYFKKGGYSHEVNCNEDLFKARKVRINFGVGRLSLFNWLINPLINLNHAFYCRFFAWTFPASEIEYELIVVK